MVGKIVGTVLTLMFMTFLIFLISFYFLHTSIRESVNRFNYSVCESIATSGEFSEYLYNYLKDGINKYGKYDIKLRLEKQIKPGVYDTYLNNEDIIGRKLMVGDRVTIYLEDEEPSLFGRLINASFFGHAPDRLVDTNIKSIKTAVISKDAKNLVKGYDVISDISEKANGWKTAVFVATKRNPEGRLYGTFPHPDIITDNPIYGDEPQEDGNLGTDYIFDNGDFIKEEILYDESAGELKGTQRVVRYIQQ